MHFDPSQAYVQLTPEGRAQLISGGERFWSRPAAELDGMGADWLVAELECPADGSNWEMHPEADELVYLLWGAAVMLLEQPAAAQEVPLRGRAAVVVPKGTLHTVKPSEPSRMQFVTMGRGTRHRAA